MQSEVGAPIPAEKPETPPSALRNVTLPEDNPHRTAQNTASHRSAASAALPGSQRPPCPAGVAAVLRRALRAGPGAAVCGTAVGARRAGAAQSPHRALRRGTALLTGKMGTAEKVTWKFVGFCVFVVKYIGVTKQEPNAKLMQTKKKET